MHPLLSRLKKHALSARSSKRRLKASSSTIRQQPALSFSMLPADVLLCVADFLGWDDLAVLLCINRKLHGLLAPYLYRRIVLDAPNGELFLMWAAKNGFSRVFLNLLEQGACPHEGDWMGMTPLLAAVLGPGTVGGQVVTNVVSGEMEIKYPDGWTGPRVTFGDEDNHGWRLNRVGGQEHGNGNRWGLRERARQSDDASDTSSDPQVSSIDTDSSWRYRERLTLSLGARDNSTILQGREEAIMHLLSLGDDAACRCGESSSSLIPAANKSGYGVLHHASVSEVPVSESVLDLIIAKGADINARTYYGAAPLHLAAHLRHDTIARYLVSHGAIIDAKDKADFTPLHNVCTSIHPARNYVIPTLRFYRDEMRDPASILLDLLIENGADIHARTSKPLSESTPLHLAISSRDLGSGETVRRLLAYGAKVDAKDTFGLTPLHLACCAVTNSQQKVRYLLDAGANANARTAELMTPLFYAADKGFSPITELLISRNADVDLADRHGRTPLMAATRRGFTRIVEMLCKAGADVFAVDALGRNALCYQEYVTPKELNDVLETYGLKYVDEDDDGDELSLVSTRVEVDDDENRAYL